MLICPTGSLSSKTSTHRTIELIHQTMADSLPVWIASVSLSPTVFLSKRRPFRAPSETEGDKCMQIIQNIWIQNLFANLHLFYLCVWRQGGGLIKLNETLDLKFRFISFLFNVLFSNSGSLPLCPLSAHFRAYAVNMQSMYTGCTLKYWACIHALLGHCAHLTSPYRSARNEEHGK